MKPPGTPRRSRWNLVFLISGVFCLGWYGYTFADRVFYQARQSWLFDHQTGSADVSGPVRELAPAPRAFPDAIQLGMPKLWDAPPVTVLSHAVKHEIVKTVVPPPLSMIGRLSVPRLHISVMVREGVDDDTLQKAVGHIPSTALPGQAGNVGLAGHRDTFFRDLRHVQTRDQIQFSTADREFNYEVESVIVVGQDAIEVLAASPDKSLTLVTCYPFYYIGNAPKRFIVRAKQVSDALR